MLAAHPDIVIYALRLDRGLSPADVLATVPGTRWDEERGLNDHQYIVPGAGGVGEILNNAWVLSDRAAPSRQPCRAVLASWRPRIAICWLCVAASAR